MKVFKLYPLFCYMRIGIIGTGDINIIYEHAKISKKQFERLLEDAAKLVADLGLVDLLI